jgi:WD repeat-containing protein 19
MFMRGEIANPTSRANLEHNAVCFAGAARCKVRVGDVQGGVAMAVESGDKRLMRDCAAILEQSRHLLDAAQLYVRAEAYEKAASLFIQLKDFSHAGPLMARITAPKLHAAYAKAKEAEGSYAQAADSYEVARDFDSVVRLCLQHLQQPQRAFDLVRASRSPEGARLVAQYCQARGDIACAIEFLLLAGAADDAFLLATLHKSMEVFAQQLGGEGTTEQYVAIAQYYESTSDFARAGDYYAQLGDLKRALKLFMLCGEQRIHAAIELVRRAHGSPDGAPMMRVLHDYLLGESDGVVKDPKYVFELYVAVGDFAQAADTAMVIARQEQNLGNYKAAHDMLLEVYQALVSRKVAVPDELRRALLLLHSYTLVRRLAKLQDHRGAARLLVRVAGSISRFPSHVVPILTTTVIECHRAGLRRSAFEYASLLMRPEYRNAIDPRYKQKIETLVRRPNQSEEDEQLTPCPFCETPLPVSMLDCPTCKNFVPYCVSTGMHVVASDLCVCPACRFPSLHSALTAQLAVESSCAMCGAPLTAAALVRMADPREYLAKPVGGGKSVHGGNAAGGGGLLLGGANAPTAPAAAAAAGALPSGSAPLARSASLESDQPGLAPRPGARDALT